MFAKTANYTTTLNGMPAFKTTNSACLDLFYNFGAMRGQDPMSKFKAACLENPNLALRILLWGRDARGGAGERQLFRSVLSNLSDLEATLLLPKIPEVGRWDDLLSVPVNTSARTIALEMIKNAIEEGNGLAAKWMPRKGPVASELRKAWKMTAKQYRKFLVAATNVVETQMCSGNWKEIEFSKVPSVAMSKYNAAFQRHNPVGFQKYKDALTAGTTKVNANAVFPYQILEIEDAQLRTAMWDAQPNYMVANSAVLPVVDRSGSMSSANLKGSKLTAEDIAVSLGLYCATKNTGPFKDLVVSFADKPEIQLLQGTLNDKLYQIKHDLDVGYSTNLMATLDLILTASKAMGVRQEEMPKILLFLSDMQFNDCNAGEWNETLLKTMQTKYTNAGYLMPAVVFWNLVSYGNVPALGNEEGVMMISGFSPSILKGVLSSDFSRITPEKLMLDVVLSPKYDF